MKTLDAIGQEITIGAQYGYSKSQNGITWVVTGTAVAAEGGKVTLDEIVEKNYTGLYRGTQDSMRTTKGGRKRTVGSVQLFRITDVKYNKLKADLKELLDMDIPNDFENYSPKLYLELIKD